MFPTILIALFLLSQTHVKQAHAAPKQAVTSVLASHVMPLDDRYPVPSVSEVFKDNILLDLAYLRGTVASGSTVNWDQVEKPFTYSFTLNPGQVFAFHDAVLPQFQGKVVKTTNSHFSSTEGYKSDGYLFADGVCHGASFINWVATDAGLSVTAPTNHDFAHIPDVPKKNGTAIYYDPNSPSSDALQNLYVENNKAKPVTFVFQYDGKGVKLSITEG